MAFVDLRRGSADAALRGAKQPPSDPELFCAQLQSQHFVLVAAPSIAATISAPDDIVHAPFVCLKDRYEELLAGIAQHVSLDIQPSSLLVMDNFYGMLRAAERGHGLAFAMRPLIDPWLKEGRLVALPSAAGPSERALYFICVRRDAERPAIRLLRAWLEELFVERGPGMDKVGIKPPHRRRSPGRRSARQDQ